MDLFRAIFLTVMFLAPVGAVAQETQVPFGGLQHDASQPVEITAERLAIDQEDGSAVFEGNVIVGQGEMRLSAEIVRVEYAAEGDENTGRIGRLLASGGVTLLSGTEAAEAETAEYSIVDGTIIMTGNVILTQGQNAMSAERAVITLETGSAILEGRVRTILQTGGKQ